MDHLSIVEGLLADEETVRATSHTETRLTGQQIGWLSDHGPYPFVCNGGRIHWEYKTDAEVLGFLDARVQAGGDRTAAEIAYRIREKQDIDRAGQREEIGKLIDPSEYRISAVWHDNTPEPGQKHMASECPGVGQCLVADYFANAVLPPRLTDPGTFEQALRNFGGSITRSEPQ